MINMNIVDVARDQLAQRMDNTIKDTENIADILTEEQFGPLDAVKNVHSRFYSSNKKLIEDIQRLFG